MCRTKLCAAFSTKEIQLHNVRCYPLLFDGKKFRQRLISWKPPWQQGFLSISKNFVFLPYISKTSASEEILTLPHEKSGEKNWSGKKTTKRSDLVKKMPKTRWMGKSKEKGWGQLTKQKWPCLVLCQKKLIQYYTKIVIRYDNEQNLLCGPIRGTQRNSNSSRHGNISLFDIWDLF